MGKNKEPADIGRLHGVELHLQAQDDGSSISIGSLATLTAAMDASLSGIERSLYKVGLKLYRAAKRGEPHASPRQRFLDKQHSVPALVKQKGLAH